MVKENQLKSGRSGPDRKSRLVALVLAVAALCAISFYLGGVLKSEEGRILVETFAAESLILNKGCAPVIKQEHFNESNTLTEDVLNKSPEPVLSLRQSSTSLIPLYSAELGKRLTVNFENGIRDVLGSCIVAMRAHGSLSCNNGLNLQKYLQRWRKFQKQRMAFRERHCPPRAERLECLIPPPEGYKPTMPWPQSYTECWYKNVPYDWINTEKANQNWLKKEDDKFVFPGGGTMFPNGVDEYVDHMEELIPGMKDGSIRTALDTGCGVASWGGALLSRNILAVSLAPRDNHEAQVQFALERGIPAIIGIISTQRLPFPANSFDLAHCSRCLIPWTDFGGVYLLEIDRVLRPGGFWVLSGPPVNYEVHWKGWESTAEKQKADLDAIKDLLRKMCYTEYAAKDDLAVWQKPLDNTCYKEREAGIYPPTCDDAIEADVAWYVPMGPCIVPQHKDLSQIAVDSVPKWPARLSTAPQRLKLTAGGSNGGFNQDTKTWKEHVKHYKTILPELGTDKIRNVMDTHTLYGSFAASLIDDPVWVMNVVSSYATNSLGVVFDRGLIGTYHDWCEAFSTYPRTYDLLHVAGHFTAESHRCEMKFVMLELDRILRPGGHVLIRDAPYFLENANTIAEAMRWKCSEHETDSVAVDSERILLCKKTFWTSSEIPRVLES